MEIKKLLDRKFVQNKKGTMTESEIHKLVKEWQDQRTANKLNKATVEREMKAMEKAVQEINVTHLGNTPTE